jgi:hypothetical protein
MGPSTDHNPVKYGREREGNRLTNNSLFERQRRGPNIRQALKAALELSLRRAMTAKVIWDEVVRLFGSGRSVPKQISCGLERESSHTPTVAGTQ